MTAGGQVERMMVGPRWAATVTEEALVLPEADATNQQQRETLTRDLKGFLCLPCGEQALAWVWMTGDTDPGLWLGSK